MKLGLVAKLATAGMILTGITGAVAFGNVPGVNQEVKAQQDNPNSGHFKKTVDGKELDFTDIFSRNTLTPKDLSDEIKKKLDEQGLTGDYNFNLKVTKSDGSTIEGAGKAGQVPSNQSSVFDPTKDKIEVFEISK
ncbi:hypothetical protein [Staphylococcus pseudintermedius]|uniref:hypothetical protein n=1 Tax=Staphylococcus pseudintermedius TaxID=283734 RepID=UPI002EDADBB1